MAIDTACTKEPTILALSQTLLEHADNLNDTLASLVERSPKPEGECVKPPVNPNVLDEIIENLRILSSRIGLAQDYTLSGIKHKIM